MHRIASARRTPVLHRWRPAVVAAALAALIVLALLVTRAAGPSSRTFEDTPQHRRLCASRMRPVDPQLFVAHNGAAAEGHYALDLSRFAIDGERVLAGDGTAVEVAVRLALEEARVSGSQVAELDLSDNGLRDVPGSVFELLPELTVLFLSKNALRYVPVPLRNAMSVRRLSLKGNALTVVDVRYLPPSTEHLILTDNAIAATRNLCALQGLRKLMLSGNRLRSVGDVLSLSATAGVSKACPALELLRLSRNPIAAVTEADAVAVAGLRRLQWISIAGAPVSQRDAATPLRDVTSHTKCDDSAPVLGGGASGSVLKCRLLMQAPGSKQADDGQQVTVSLPVALKRFKPTSSDGSGEDELRVLGLVPTHPNVLRAFGRVGALGAVFPLARPMTPLGQPPNIRTVTDARWAEDSAKPFTTPRDFMAAVQGIAEAMKALHAAGIAHGDLYPHNVFRAALADVVAPASDAALRSPAEVATLQAGLRRALNPGSAGDGSAPQPRALVTDFGASFDMSRLPASMRRAVVAAEVRAFGALLRFSLEHHAPAGVEAGAAEQYRSVLAMCARDKDLSFATVLEHLPQWQAHSEY